MTTKNRRMARRVPDLSRPIVTDDLVPLSEALRRLTDWYKRDYTLADIELLNVEGNDRFTPVFHYAGKAVLYNPEVVVNDDLLEHYDGYVPDKVYSQYFEIWLRSQSTIVDIDGWFSLDIYHIKGIELNQSAKLTTYLNSPQATIASKAMVKIDRIHEDQTYKGNVAYFPIDAIKHRGKELAIPINVKTIAFNIGVHDWYVPVKQIDSLHPDYKLIYKVDNRHYISDNGNAGLYADAIPIDITSLDARFYTLITNINLMPYSIQLLSSNKDTQVRKSSQPIDPSEIGHNGRVAQNKLIVSMFANQIWQDDDPNKVIRTGDMCQIVRRFYTSKEIQLPNTDRSLKKYFKSITPEYASKGGTNTRNKEQLINEIVAKYSQTE